MPIISISRGSYHRGRDVAHAVAEKLRYECISRGSLLENSDIYDTPEIRLMPDVKHAAHVLERFSFGRERYTNYMADSILRFLKNDNHVYHGLAGQFFVDGVSHVVKVRVIADLNERVEAEARRNTISLEDARAKLIKDDEERRKWAMLLYGVDISEPSNYDMVLNISTMTVQDAADLVAQAAQMECYQATKESRRKVTDLSLKFAVKVALFDFPRARVHVDDGKVRVQAKLPESQRLVVEQRMTEAITALDGVAEYEIDVSPFY